MGNIHDNKVNILISFVICTTGRSKELNRCLRSTDSQEQVSEYCETIVVDQSGKKCIREICSSYRRTKYYYSSKIGLSYNRNLAFPKANGEWISFLDDDCWLDPKYLINFQKHCNRRTKPALLIIDALNPDGRSFYVRSFKPKKIAKHGTISRELYRSICSISIIFSRDVFGITGGFDTRFGVGSTYPSCEETDLLLTAVSKGINIYYCSGITVYHPKQILKFDYERVRKAYFRAQGHGALYRKHLFNNEFGHYYFIFKFLESVLGSVVKSFCCVYHPFRFLFHMFVFFGKIKGFLTFRR